MVQQRPTARELLKHKFVRMAKKTNYLTELIERHERWKAEGGERLEEEEQAVTQDLYAMFNSKPVLIPTFSPLTLQARQRRPRGLVGLWDRPARRTNGRACQQLDQSLGAAFDVGDERLRARRHLDVLHLDQAHLELVDQGRPAAHPVVIPQVGASSERVRAGDGQTYAERQTGSSEWPGGTRTVTVGRRRV